MASTLGIQQIKIDFHPAKINEKINIRAKGKEISAIRGIVQRKLSDYISERIPGFSKALTQQQKAFFKTPGAAPDGVIDLAAFQTLTGIAVGQSKVLQDAALGAQEAKVTGIGGSSTIDITAKSIAKSGPLFQVIKEEATKLGQKGIAGSDAINVIFTDKRFGKIKNDLIVAATQKLENLLLINTLDKDKNPKFSIGFVANPLGNIKNISTNSIVFEKYFSINIKEEKRARPEFGVDPVRSTPKKTVYNKGVVKFKIQLRTKAELISDIKAGMQDITDKVVNLHNTMSQAKFSKGLLAHFLAEKPKLKSQDEINLYLSLAVGFALEFERGGRTPFLITTKLEANLPPKIRNMNVNVTSKAAGKKPQKIISGAQLTALVQQRLRKIMPQGPRRGPPLSPTTMTNRTGRFRRSIHVIPRYRQNVMRYMYDPIYMSLIDTPYNPDVLITNTIREVVQTLFGRQFAVLRAQ